MSESVKNEDDEVVENFLAKLVLEPTVRYEFFSGAGEGHFGLSPEQMERVRERIEENGNRGPNIVSGHVIVAISRFEVDEDKTVIIEITAPPENLDVEKEAVTAINRISREKLTSGVKLDLRVSALNADDPNLLHEVDSLDLHVTSMQPKPE